MSDPADALRRTVDALRDICDRTGWLAFDSLLSVVREGWLHPVDDPLTLSFLAGHPGHPGQPGRPGRHDAVRETFRVVRRLRQHGWDAEAQGDGTCTVTGATGGASRDVTLHACWYSGDALVLAPGIHLAAGAAAVLPTTDLAVDGTALPAPAEPDRVLAATYGDRWRTMQRPYATRPRPAPERVERAPGYGRHRRRWERFYRGMYGVTAPREPSRFGQWAAAREREQQPQTPPGVVDVGCGNGRDSRHFADQGHAVLGLDYAPAALAAARANLGEQVGRAELRLLDLYDLRSTLLLGAELAGADRPAVLYARFLPHALDDDGRENLWRLGAMALRRGGRMYLEFRTDKDEAAAHVFEGQHYRRYLDPHEVAAEAKRHGGAVVHREQGYGLAPYRSEDPHICRLVVQWAR